MFAQVVVFICLATLSTAVPIDYGLSGPSLIHSAPAVSTILSHGPAVVSNAPAYVEHAPAFVAHTPAVVAAPAIAVKKVIAEPYDPNPQYSYSYGVSDHHTGDSKHAEESLVNGVVHGSYSLSEPDGTIRKVSYTADDLHGFNAVVEKKGAVVAHAPAIVSHAAPLYHGYH